MRICVFTYPISSDRPEIWAVFLKQPHSHTCGLPKLCCHVHSCLDDNFLQRTYSFPFCLHLVFSPHVTSWPSCTRWQVTHHCSRPTDPRWPGQSSPTETCLWPDWPENCSPAHLLVRVEFRRCFHRSLCLRHTWMYWLSKQRTLCLFACLWSILELENQYWTDNDHSLKLFAK